MTASTATIDRTTIRNLLNDEFIIRLLQRITVADKSKATTISALFIGQELAQVPVDAQVDVDEAFKRVRAAQKE